MLAWIRLGRGREPHVDDEFHTEVMQSVVIFEGGHVADEEVVGDFREVHMGKCYHKITV